jgi:thiosulfate reductase cytochrome b subunit
MDALVKCDLDYFFTVIFRQRTRGMFSGHLQATNRAMRLVDLGLRRQRSHA